MNAKCNKHQYKNSCSLDDLTDKDTHVSMSGDPVRMLTSSINSKNHRNEDNLKSVKFRERAMAVNQLISMLGLIM